MKKNMPLPRILASHSTILPLLMRPFDFVKIRYFKDFNNVPFFNPYWLAFKPQVCLLPVADRPWTMTQMDPIGIVIVW